MAYLTKSNSIKIISSIHPNKIENLKGEVYKKPIYFFSKYEKNKLLGIKELMKDPESFIGEYYVPINNADNLRYVYEGGKPAYHSRPDCERLNSDYRNFEIPEEIREKGKEEVFKFRDWFKKNQYLLEKPDVFVARIQMAFGVTMNPKAIDHENSGVEEKENLNLEELEKRINKLLSDAGQYFNNADKKKREVIRRFQKYTFLAYSKNDIRNNTTSVSDEAIKNFLKQYDIHFKRPTKDLLIEYYRVLHNPDLKFEGYLLEQLGFQPCGACHNDNHQQVTSESNENELYDYEIPF